jgi:hypothetical protein
VLHFPQLFALFVFGSLLEWIRTVISYSAFFNLTAKCFPYLCTYIPFDDCVAHWLIVTLKTFYLIFSNWEMVIYKVYSLFISSTA